MQSTTGFLGNRGSGISRRLEKGNSEKRIEGEDEDEDVERHIKEKMVFGRFAG